MKSPSFPSDLPITALTDTSLASNDEVRQHRFAGGQVFDLQTEHVMLDQVQLHGSYLIESHLYAPRFADVRLTACSLANTMFEKLIVHRAEFADCQLVGFNAVESYFQHVHFHDCDCQLAGFRFCYFKWVTFERCNLQGANFQGADLSGVRFIKCDLSGAEMSQATLKGADFRTSKIDEIRVGAPEVVGAVVDHFQAAYMASLLGLVIKAEDEE